MSSSAAASRTVPKRQLSRETEQRLRTLQKERQSQTVAIRRKATPAATPTAASSKPNMAPKRTPTFSGHDSVVPARPARKVLSVNEVQPDTAPVALTPANVTGTTPLGLPPRHPEDKQVGAGTVSASLGGGLCRCYLRYFRVCVFVSLLSTESS